MNGYEALAAELDELAEWSEDALAGGEPPKHVAQHAAGRTRQIAYAAAMAARGRIAPDDLGGMLGRDGMDTVLLGRPWAAVKPPERRGGLHPVRSARAWLARAWARAWLSC